MHARAIFSSAAVFLLVGASLASGTVTNLRLYHLGEADPGAIPLGAGDDPTVDSVGGVNASKVGLTYYDGISGLGGPATGIGLAPGSTMSMGFLNIDSRYTAPAVTGITDDFGMEAYIEPGTASDARPFLDGGGGDPLGALVDGYGLLISGGQYQGSINGTLISTGVPAIPGVPVEMAFVRNAGLATVYINDVPVGSSGVVPIAPVAGEALSLGNFEATEAFPNFAGVVDEARFFTFNPGDFNPITDLGPAAVPEPASIILCGAMPLFFGRRRDR